MAWRPLSCLPRQALSHILDGTDIVQLSCLPPLPQGLELNLIHLCHVKAPSTDLASSFHEHMSRNPRPGQYASYRCLLFLLIAVSRGSYLSQSPHLSLLPAWERMWAFSLSCRLNSLLQPVCILEPKVTNYRVQEKSSCWCLRSPLLIKGLGEGAVGSEAGRAQRTHGEALSPAFHISPSEVMQPNPINKAAPTYEKGHLYFLKGSWMSICLFSLSLRLNADSHTEHL